MTADDKDCTVGAIVVTYNRKFFLEECLKSLLSQTRPVESIIVVDNASTDGTYEFLRKNGYLTDRLIDYIRLSENSGGAGGFYEGVKRGYERGYDWLWLMDDDAEPQKDALQKLLSSRKASLPGTLGLIPKKIDLEGNIQRYQIGYIDSKYYIRPLSEQEYSRDDLEIDYCSFVGLLIKREVVSHVGLPNRDMFIRSDDVEYCIRIREKGSLVFVRDSVILHKEKIQYEGGYTFIPMAQYWKQYYDTRNKIFVLRKYFKKSLLSIFIFIFIKGVIKNLLFSDGKWIRIQLLTIACLDGVRNKLGIYITPEDWTKLHKQ